MVGIVFSMLWEPHTPSKPAGMTSGKTLVHREPDPGPEWCIEKPDPGPERCIENRIGYLGGASKNRIGYLGGASKIRDLVLVGASKKKGIWYWVEVCQS